ncbi:S9 family peptidase [Asticcacaulis sp. BYS171W]|uniref:S9 family peptidase n=1 Tax=Asticcacaulis aquaticus TaxID=2984212 RepID=A0ABT5HVW6_9CAUL|nr:S9 family peptidase [Asticcacaulis aquaticus]MDC7684236.1 S9 family peptidase [Asticcacaulis aquaticus]
MRSLCLVLLLSVSLPALAIATPDPAAATAELPRAQARMMTAVDLLSLQRASDPKISPDGQTVLYRVSTADWKKNKVTLSLWRAKADGTEPRLMVEDGGSDLTWSPDSRHFAFVAKRGEDKASQIYVMSLDGGEAKRLTDSAKNVGNLKWSDDGRFIYFTAQTPDSKTDKKRIADKDDMFAFEEPRGRNTLRRADAVTGKLHTLVSGDFDVKSYDVAANGETVAYVRAPSRLLDDGQFGEIWLHTGKGADHRLTDNNYGESGVKIAPDGKTILFLANAKDGRYGTVNTNLFVLDATSKAITELGTRTTNAPAEEPGWEIESAAFAPDGKSVFFTANEGVRSTLNRVPVTGGAWTILITGDSVVSDFDVASGSGRLAYIQSSAMQPAELYALDPAKKPVQVSHLNDNLAQRFRLPKQEAVQWTAPDGQKLEGLITYPLDYVAGKAYPLIVQSHGGPRSVDQFNIFSYGRLNPLLAAHGIMTLSVNYRGGTAYGDTFLQGMNGGYFKYADKDVLSGVDELIKRGLADPERLGTMGWSAGGHMTNRLITTTNRFKAAASGAGTVDWTSMYLTSDTRWQRQEWFITPPYGTTARRDLYEEYSALSRLDKVTTPTLIMAGAEDDRVPTQQSIMLYRSLKMLGVETELYLAPREPHNFAELRHRLFQVNKHMDWFLKHLTGETYMWDKAPDVKADDLDTL